MDTTLQDGTTVNEAIIKKIVESVKNMEFGSILIKVHASKIVKIEVTKSRSTNLANKKIFIRVPKVTRCLSINTIPPI